MFSTLHRLIFKFYVERSTKLLKRRNSGSYISLGKWRHVSGGSFFLWHPKRFCHTSETLVWWKKCIEWAGNRGARVTRLGEFSTIGRMFTLGRFFENYRSKAKFLVLFPPFKLYIIYVLTKIVGLQFGLLLHKIIRSPCSEPAWLEKQFASNKIVLAESIKSHGSRKSLFPKK
jgi:hypothetical protein